MNYNTQMRVLFLCGREIDYPRNQVLLRAMQRLGKVEVIAGERSTRSLVWRSLIVGLKALPHLLFGKHDLVFVGFYGHLIVLEAGLLTRKPILFDAFVSNFDTLVGDRRKVKAGSLPARMALWLDKTSCSLADRVLLDTQAHVDYFTQTFHLPGDHFRAIPVGATEDVFRPIPHSTPNEFVNVLSYSTYLPLHGMDVIVRAIALLKEKPFHFEIIGEGQEYPAVRSLANQFNLPNVTFEPPLPLRELPQRIAKADICLGGHFGESGKAARTIPGKIYQMLAMGKAIIAADNPANRELLTHDTTAYLCPPGDPGALADALLTLGEDAALRARLEGNARKLFLERCSETAITDRLRDILCDLIPEKSTAIRAQ